MKSQRVQERIIDAVGSVIVAACAAGFFWSIAGGSELTRGEIAHLKKAIEKASTDVRSLRDRQTRLREVLAQRREALERSGQLPAHAPVEEYFQTLSAQATDHGLRVMRHQPVSERTYPGLLEQCYLFEVAGTTQSVVRFLQTIEKSDFWADVSYLAIDANSQAVRTGAPDSNPSDAIRRATLTISLFSAPDTELPGNLPEDA